MVTCIIWRSVAVGTGGLVIGGLVIAVGTGPRGVLESIGGHCGNVCVVALKEVAGVDEGGSGDEEWELFV